ncbi:mucin-6-like [Amblyraja radiata]|uniref:mucin-6-like n=1 Tax=Amblyraja radiata TaxID=386614 RepID=UPI0014034753|nr:mucin-6-like [Amblyraja radiata]
MPTKAYCFSSWLASSVKEIHGPLRTPIWAVCCRADYNGNSRNEALQFQPPAPVGELKLRHKLLLTLAPVELPQQPKPPAASIATSGPLSERPTGIKLTYLLEQFELLPHVAPCSQAMEEVDMEEAVSNIIQPQLDGITRSRDLIVQDALEQLQNILKGEGEQPEVVVHVGTNNIDPTKGTCYTWGTNHFQTFDNKIFVISTTCNYIFASDSLGDFNIQLRRGTDGNILRIIIEIFNTVIKVENGNIIMSDIGTIEVPYRGNQIQIYPVGDEYKLIVNQPDLDLAVTWDNACFLMVELGDRHQNKTCGLCGDFNGSPDFPEFVFNGESMDIDGYVAMHQIDDPSEDCHAEHQLYLTTDYTIYLLNIAAPFCELDRTDYIMECQQDLSQCLVRGDRNCACATLSQFSRQCSRALQPVSNWRNSTFCPMADCPANQVYQECGSPCLSTCLNPQFTCDSYCKPGCFCPEGTVLDYITSKYTCIPRNQCPCVQNGKIYAPGEKKDTLCSSCTCVGAQWDCSDIQCPGTCSVEGGSFVTTFDESTYRFHGDCQYLLVGESFLLLLAARNCIVQKLPNQPGMRAFILHFAEQMKEGRSMQSQSNKIPNHGTIEAAFEQCGSQYTETRLSSVIYATHETKIVFTRSSMIEVNNQFKDLPFRAGNIKIYKRSSSYIQMDTDCGLGLLIKMTEVFQVYIMVGNCKFVTCNYEQTNDFMCASLDSYASACAKRGIILAGWRNVMDGCGISCSFNQVFSYDSRVCHRTCLSLSNPEFECTSIDPPVDGCNCPDNTYQDISGQCVDAAECPCFLANILVAHANQQITLNGGTCFCTRGKWNCQGSGLCPSTCMVHGEGHVTTFDGKQYVFDGNCEYILVQDACSAIYSQPSFKIVAEYVYCSQSKTVCTKAIKVYYKDFLIKMTDATYKVIPESAVGKFTVIHNQMYLTFQFGDPDTLQLIVTWNLKMNTYIQIIGLSKFSVCGLCGNANGNIKDELITQTHYSASTLMSFVNSWKDDPMCEDVTEVVYPCAKNPYRKSWAEKRCKIIPSDVFRPCHKLLRWFPYYYKCNRDACGCELVGDCECLCDAVAAFAKACLDAGVCIDWRTPDFCPVNCDFYNTHEQDTNIYKYDGDIKCNWHYQPCLCPNAPWTFSKSNMEGKKPNN